MDTRAKFLAAGLAISGLLNIIAIGFIAWHYGLGSFADVESHEAALESQRQKLEGEYQQALARAVETARTEGIALGRSQADAERPTQPDPAPQRPTPTPAPSEPQIVFPTDVATDHGHSIEQEYDDFDDTTTVALEIEDLADSVTEGSRFGIQRIELAMFDVFEGRQRQTASSSVLMRIMVAGSSSAGWRYLECHPLAVRADGFRFNPETEWDGDISTSLEFIYCSWPIEELLAIANADSVRMKLCNTEFELNDQQREAIRHYASLLAP